MHKEYDDIFALIAYLETIRLIISLATKNNWKIFQINVKYVFLNGHLEEKVYMEQPMDFVLR